MDLPSRLLMRRLPPPWAVAVAFAVGAAAIVLVAMAGKLGTAARSVSPGARPTTPAADTSARRKRRRPNIVVVMTDDQALSQTRYMPNVQRLLARAGTTFTNFYASYPLCCPSRATFLTGQYAHNDGVRENGGNRGGFHALKDASTLPVWLQRAGYHTAMLGKYLNGYGQQGTNANYVPPGWSEWHGLAPERLQYGYRMNENGQLVTYGNAPTDYLTDVLSRKATDIIKQQSAARKPFFIFMTPTSPHDETGLGSKPNPRPAPREAGAFSALPLPQPPNFNEADVSDKPSFIQRPPIKPGNVNEIARRYRERTASLLAIDDAVGSIVHTLKATGQLNNTMIVFTTDNGFFFGEHRIPNGKVLPYDPSTKLPLIVRGPGFKRHRRSSTLVSNVDLAPTIAALAHARPGLREDGRSLLPVLRGRRVHWRRSLLLEAGDGLPPKKPQGGEPARAPDYFAVRSKRWVYIEWATGATELYDMRSDPYQLDNIAGDPRVAGSRAALARRLSLLKSCSGSQCLR